MSDHRSNCGMAELLWKHIVIFILSCMVWPRMVEVIVVNDVIEYEFGCLTPKVEVAIG